jgi:hypothetical protein
MRLARSCFERQQSRGRIAAAASWQGASKAKMPPGDAVGIRHLLAALGDGLVLRQCRSVYNSL